MAAPTAVPPANSSTTGPRTDVRILVFGAGSLGSLIGGLLAREHEVVLVGREPHMAAVREDGLRVRGLLETDVAPRATTAVDAPADLAVVTVKAPDTAEAATALADAELDAALSLTNGLGNEEILATTLPVPVLAGTVTYGAVLREPGLVECTGVGTVTLGPLPGVTVGDEPPGLAERIGDAFAVAGIETSVEVDMRRPLWSKLAVNAGINPVTALARLPNGALLDGPGADLARRATREAAATAREAGVDLTGADATADLEAVVEATAANTSSMRQDVEAGRRTEIDAINGAVVDRASTAVPANDVLTTLVRAWEAGRGLREAGS